MIQEPAEEDTLIRLDKHEQQQRSNLKPAHTSAVESYFYNLWFIPSNEIQLWEAEISIKQEKSFINGTIIFFLMLELSVFTQSKTSSEEKSGSLNDFPESKLILLSLWSCFCKEHVSVHSQLQPPGPPWRYLGTLAAVTGLSPRRGFAAWPWAGACSLWDISPWDGSPQDSSPQDNSPQDSSPTAAAHTYENTELETQPRSRCHKYLLAIVNVELQGLFFFQFYFLDSLCFHSQNRFYSNKGFYYYYSPVITQH